MFYNIIKTGFNLDIYITMATKILNLIQGFKIIKKY